LKAIVYTRYGSPDVLKYKEVDRPEPKADEVLIRVCAASLNSRDWRMMRANPFFIRFMVGGLLRPKVTILGVDVAGRVEAVGSQVSEFNPGDEVFGCLHRYGGGALAEYGCAARDEIVPKPANVSFEQAAAVPVAAITALQGLRDKGNLQAGQKVLIQGASGGVGTFAVQLAREFGAEVTGVCSTRNLDMVRSLGAGHVIDYTKEDFSRAGQRYDLILAVNGYHSMAAYQRALNPGGRLVVAGGSMRQLFGAMASRRPNTHVVSAAINHKDLVLVKEMLETGKIAPVIDAAYPLSQAADAFRYFEQVHPKGKVVIGIAA